MDPERAEETSPRGVDVPAPAAMIVIGIILLAVGTVLLVTTDDLSEPSRYGIPAWVSLAPGLILPAALIASSAWTIVKHRRQDAVDPFARARREAVQSARPPDPVATTLFHLSGVKVLFWLVVLVGSGLWVRYAGQNRRASSCSAIWTALSAAPLRRLSPTTNIDSPRPSGTVGSARTRPT